MSFNNINQTNFEHTFQAKVTFLSNTFFGSDVDISQKLDVRGASRFQNISVFDIDIRGGTLTVRNLDVSDDISVKNISVTEDISIGKQLKDGDDNFGSAGQVLSSDGTDLAWINTSDANVGSATNVGVNLDNTDADQWMTFVGANSGNRPIRVNNLLRINPSRSFVGIGTADPNEQLHIHQIGTNAPILRVEATSTNPELDLKSADDGTAKIKFSDDNDAAGSIVYDHGHNKMKFMIDTTTSFWISPNAHFRLFEAFEDGSGSAGTSGQVLSSTGDKTEWINVGSVAAGSASTVAITQVSDDADHHIVFADTTSGIQGLQASTGLKINPSNNQLTAGSFVKASNSGGFLKADGTEDTNTYLTSDANTTYDLSVPSSTTKIRLAGSDSSNDDVEIAGAGTVSVTRTNANKLTITGPDLGMSHSSKTSSYTLTASDDNRLITTNSNVTVPANVFSVANATTIYNNSTSNITITQGGSVTLRLSGSNITGTRTLAQRGVCTVMCVASNEFIITGSGLA